MARKKSLLIPFLKVGVWIGALVPLGLLANDFLSGAYLLADPIELIQHRTGTSALVLLLLTLSVTPLRTLTGWNRFIRFRRLLGLFVFFYAMLHAFSYFVFDQRLSLMSILEDVAENNWVLVGFTAFLLLIPLAVTSTNGWIRRMGGRNWTRLHMLVYPTAVLGVLHFIWLVKADLYEPLIYAAILLVLLGTRTTIWWSNRRSHSTAPPERPRGSTADVVPVEGPGSRKAVRKATLPG